MKHLKLFQTEAEYTAYKNGNDFVTPNVSYIVDSTNTFYNPIKLITFTVENVSYQAIEGMTWEDWVNSSYNTNNYINAGTYIGKDNEYGSINKSNIAVLPTDIITVYSYDWIVGGFVLPGTEEQ